MSHAILNAIKPCIDLPVLLIFLMVLQRVPTSENTSLHLEHIVPGSLGELHLRSQSYHRHGRSMTKARGIRHFHTRSSKNFTTWNALSSFRRTQIDVLMGCCASGNCRGCRMSGSSSRLACWVGASAAGTSMSSVRLVTMSTVEGTLVVASSDSTGRFVGGIGQLAIRRGS